MCYQPEIRKNSYIAFTYRLDAHPAEPNQVIRAKDRFRDVSRIFALYFAHSYTYRELQSQLQAYLHGSFVSIRVSCARDVLMFKLHQLYNRKFRAQSISRCSLSPKVDREIAASLFASRVFVISAFPPH